VIIQIRENNQQYFEEQEYIIGDTDKAYPVLLYCNPPGCPRTRSPEKTDQCRRQYRFQECKRRKINDLHNIVVRHLRSTNSRKGTPGVNVNRIGC
jgi:hypothetical protein